MAIYVHLFMVFIIVVGSSSTEGLFDIQSTVAYIQDVAEIVKHFKILVTCFSARVMRNAGILT
jgi:hypothetical protein